MATAPETQAEHGREPRAPRARVASLRRVLELARPEARSLALGTACLALGSVMTLLYPQGLKVIIDAAVTRRDLHELDRTAIFLGAIAVVQAAAAACRYILFTTSGERVVARLRERLYRSILDQEIAFFDGRKTGELTSRLTSDTTVLQNAVSVNVSMGLRQLAQAAGGVGFMLFTSPLLTAIILAVVPAIAFSAVIYGRRVRKLSRQVQDAIAETGEVAEESISGIRTVRAFVAEEKEGNRYAAAVGKAFTLARRRILAAGTFFAGVSLGGFLAAALVFWFGGRLVISGQMSIGSLTSFLFYAIIVGFSLGGLADLWADFMKAVGSAERVFELIDRKPAIPPSGGALIDRPQGQVVFDHVGFAYPTRPDAPVLDDVSLGIAPDEIVAVVGPSGAGKSTIAALLCRLYDPIRGRILLDGRDVRELDPHWLRGRIGVVAQEPILFSTTVAENVRYGRPDATDAEVEASARAANAHDFVSRFPDGYRTLVGERGIQLSGGQKQRVAIARAVLKDPRILILDEATSALDAESEHLVKEALDRLMHGRTTLVIAHRLSTVIDADRVVVLDGGVIVQSGSHAALMAEGGLYRRLVEKQFVAA